MFNIVSRVFNIQEDRHTYLGGSNGCFVRAFLGGALLLTFFKFNTLNSEILEISKVT